jgi:NTE family protein
MMTIGISLSGGGVKGIAHLGVLQALEEANIKINNIVGVSAGAIAGALYAAGYRPKHILKFFNSPQMLKFFQPTFSFNGVLDMEKTYKIYRVFFPDDRFETLEIPLTISATEMHQGKTVFFNSGELIRPIQASSCIPIIFKPLRIGGHYYIDGGTINNLPYEPLATSCDFKIGVHINPIGYMGNMNMKNIIERTFHLGAVANVEERKRFFDCFIEPPHLGNYSIYDFHKIKEIYQIGYDYTKGILPDMLKKMEKVASKKTIEGDWSVQGQ